ncbi:MAG TPA: hypothetical protein DHO02_02705, partial [Syntrophaceae bacterium]|nr:hypothetical protein [Syntrophaceae bacterium]
MKKLQSVFLVLIGLVLIASLPAWAEQTAQGQPVAAAVASAAAAAPAPSVTKADLDAMKGSMQVGIDTMWVLIAAFLVFFMNLG